MRRGLARSNLGDVRSVVEGGAGIMLGLIGVGLRLDATLGLCSSGVLMQLGGVAVGGRGRGMDDGI